MACGRRLNVTLNKEECLYRAAPHDGSTEDFFTTLLDYG